MTKDFYTLKKMQIKEDPNYPKEKEKYDEENRKKSKKHRDKIRIAVKLFQINLNQ